MYTLKKLSSESIQELNFILSNSIIGDKKYLDYLKTKTQGLVDYHYKGKGDMNINHFSISKNKPLVHFLLNNLSIREYDIISIHLNEYRVGGTALPHKDSNSSQTYLILLDTAEDGGDLILEDELIPFNQVGHVISYDGGKVMHGVTEIKKGYRRSLVVWVNQKTVI